MNFIHFNRCLVSPKQLPSSLFSTGLLYALQLLLVFHSHEWCGSGQSPGLSVSVCCGLSREQAGGPRAPPGRLVCTSAIAMVTQLVLLPSAARSAHCLTSLPSFSSSSSPIWWRLKWHHVLICLSLTLSEATHPFHVYLVSSMNCLFLFFYCCFSLSYWFRLLSVGTGSKHFVCCLHHKCLLPACGRSFNFVMPVQKS